MKGQALDLSLMGSLFFYGFFGPGFWPAEPAHKSPEAKEDQVYRNGNQNECGQDEQHQPDQEIGEALDEVNQILDGITGHALGLPPCNLNRLEGLLCDDTGPALCGLQARDADDARPRAAQEDPYQP